MKNFQQIYEESHKFVLTKEDGTSLIEDIIRHNASWMLTVCLSRAINHSKQLSLTHTYELSISAKDLIGSIKHAIESEYKANCDY